jgi:DNA-binding transcriptional regulator GbsR (MarR family)
MALPPVVERLVLHWGEMGTLWNVNRSVSQIHALLYFSDRPLPADEIADAPGHRALQREHQHQGAAVLPPDPHGPRAGDRRDHFEAQQDISQLFRVIVEERKKRELDPTIALLRECMADEDPRTPAHVTTRIKATLGFLETLHRWYEDMKGLPTRSSWRCCAWARASSVISRANVEPPAEHFLPAMFS